MREIPITEGEFNDGFWTECVLDFERIVTELYRTAPSLADYLR